MRKAVAAKANSSGKEGPMTQHLSPVWSHLTTFEPVRGEGVYLYDAAGERLTDFTSGIGVTNAGHCHPKVVRAVQAQAEALIFAQINCVVPPAAVELSELLNRITPETVDTFFFSNSGAEAVEGAVKLARHATGRNNLIVFQGGFHGRTAQAMAMTTAKTGYRHRYGPLPAGVFAAPFPYSYQYGWSEAETVDFCLRQLELVFKTQTAPDETAALFLEPVLGEGGYVPAPAAFLQALRDVCDAHGILLVLDEVQTGFGRTGKLFAFEHAGVTPDILVMAKGLGGGLPISAVGGGRALMERWEPGTHGGTYGGGSAVVLAGAKANLEVILDERLAENAARRGEQLSKGLRELQGRFPVIGEVRGPGLMVATEFTDTHGQPDKETCKRVQKACLASGLMLLTCGPFENVIRWIPPLVVTEAQIDEALGTFAGALEATTQPVPA